MPFRIQDACHLGSRTTDYHAVFFGDRRDAERIVENWVRDEPERAGELRIEPIERSVPGLSLPL